MTYDFNIDRREVMVLKQIKSNWYYVFWGICTVTVLAGQVYIGTGYHRFANSIQSYITQTQ
jgi:hypothetical protein